MFLAVIALFFLNSLLAQTPVINTFQSDSSDKSIEVRIRVARIESTEVGLSRAVLTSLAVGMSTALSRHTILLNDEIEPTEIITELSSMNRQSLRQQNSESKISYVPVIVFGLSGMFLGAWAGHAIEDKEDIPGEIPEVFTKGTIIGAGVGLAIGTTIGYFLGKRGKEKHNNSPK